MKPRFDHQRILEAVRAIPEGFVRTYGDVSPGAPRLAGRVLKTVHAADVPWWRVVRADGSLAAGSLSANAWRPREFPSGREPPRASICAPLACRPS